jgi:putative nucleotidyltransferase with HDIG domain
MNPSDRSPWTSRWYRQWLEWVAAPSPSLVWSWIGFFALVAIITALMTVTFSNIPSRVTVGQAATHDIRADRNYIIVDSDATARLREDMASSVPVRYEWMIDIGRDISDRVRAAFEVARDEEDPSRDAFERAIGLGLTDAQWSGLRKMRFARSAEDSIVSVVHAIMRHPIVSDKAGLVAEKDKGIVVTPVSSTKDSNGKGTEWSANEISGVWSLEEARKQVRQFKDLREDWLSSLVVQLVQTNLSVDPKATRVARDAGKSDVQEVTIAIPVGDVIVRTGERIDARHRMIIQEINHQKQKQKFSIKFIGYFVLVALILGVSYFFGSRYLRRFRLSARDARFAGTMLVVTLLAVRVSIFVASAIASSPLLGIPAGAYSYAIPVALGAMLIRFVLNAEVALVFAIIVSIFSGFFVLHDPEFTAYCLLSNIAAASFIANVDKRSSIMRAGLKTAVVNILVVAGLLLAQAYHNPVFTVGGFETLWYLAAAFLSGILDSVLVLFAAPFVETTFGYTTDMKLLELANLNHPLLRELIIRAPGTYHHSHLVGILAEAAAERIGANSLLARVGAYYHDIGKMRKPQYYIENSKDNAHWYERVNPHMAALIISSHIKDGVEMARQHGMPQQIIDMIPQHHGTKMIGFFYELAKKSNDPHLEKLSESDFRYPGPKPQTQEAGILLLSDGVEASVRALKEKTPTRIQQTVESIINKSFVESQLDECDLTLKDLTDIANAFTHILTGIYHQRIEYPKQSTEVAEKDKAI